MDNRLYFPATERNRDPILSVLRPYFAKSQSILEIASGSGEHLNHFAPHFPETIFQPTDIEPDYIKSIESWRSFSNYPNLNPPKYLNCLEVPEMDQTYDGILCINMLHISPPETLEGVVSVCEKMLNSGGFLYFYGPFKIDGKHTSESNISFEEWLKEKDSRFSVLDMADVEKACASDGLRLEEKIPMPANNFSLVFRKN